MKGNRMRKRKAAGRPSRTESLLKVCGPAYTWPLAIQNHPRECRPRALHTVSPRVRTFRGYTHRPTRMIRKRRAAVSRAPSFEPLCYRKKRPKRKSRRARGAVGYPENTSARNANVGEIPNPTFLSSPARVRGVRGNFGERVTFLSLSCWSENAWKKCNVFNSESHVPTVVPSSLRAFESSA
jgi:hypothetical protein